MFKNKLIKYLKLCEKAFIIVLTRTDKNMENDLIKLIRELNKNISIGDRIYGRCANNEHLNLIENPILYSLLIFKNLTQKDIAEEYALPKQTVNNIVKRFETDGIVTLESSSFDKRKKIIVLTPKGEEYINERLKPMIDGENKAAQLMGKEKLEKLNELLIELNDCLTKGFEK